MPNQAGQLEHNEEGKSIRIAADVSIADGTLTPRALDMMVNPAAMAIEIFHPFIVHAMKAGGTDLDRPMALRNGKERPQSPRS